MQLSESGLYFLILIISIFVKHNHQKQNYKFNNFNSIANYAKLYKCFHSIYHPHDYKFITNRTLPENFL